MKKVHLTIGKGYDLVSSSYDVLPNPAINAEGNDFLKLIGNVKNKLVLDVGCGTGRYSISLAKKGAIVYGLDYSKGMLKMAKVKAKKNNVKISFKQGSMLELPYDDNIFDLIVTSLAIEHVEDLNKVISELRRVCKLDGYILISTFQFPDSKPTGWSKIPFFIKGKEVWVSSYRRYLEDFVIPFNNHNCLIKKIKFKFVPKRFKKEMPKVYEMYKDKPIILMIKAQKK